MNFLTDFFYTLNKTEINYCVLRNYQALPESTNGSDLDILIFNDDLELFNIFLREFVKKYNIKLVSFIQDKRCPKYCLLGVNWGLQIDAFNKSIFFGGKELIPASVLFANTIIFQGVQVLNPKTGAVLAFLKEILNNKICNIKYITELQKQYGNTLIKTELLSQFPQEFVAYLNQNLNKLDAKHCKKLYNISKKNFNRSKFSGFKNKCNRLVKQPGFTIAFLGTDGSGKSTIIDNIKPILNDAFHNAVYYEHMRPNQIPSIARLSGKKESYSGPVTNPHGSKTSGYLGSLMRWSYYMVDYTFGFYLKVWPKKAIRSCVWIFDRYYYDYIIDPKRSRIKLPKWLFKLGQFIIPEPDIILCLGADATLIHKRKPELPLKEVERQVAELKAFCASHNRAVWIETGQSIENSSNSAIRVIINNMAVRFKSINL
ncbi:Thymidylate kinase [Arenibacter nanhaiticus]|uniref:Thymidylate kinase n=1 Tax=Arenibacter nanhaiticus TaxID=558155 RepID=A0A1M6LYN0_9FLAO|nr:hypothetical protein [Arenibacter nanhaiticus]SHJ76338.1 Thymidylate kinase [Arenibacter nanhaiticus]